MSKVYYEHEKRYDFPMSMDMSEVAEWLELGIIATEQPAVKYVVQHDNCLVFIDVSSSGGRALVRFLEALIEREQSSEKWKAMMDARKGTKKIDWDRVRDPIETKGSRGMLVE